MGAAVGEDSPDSVRDHGQGLPVTGLEEGEQRGFQSSPSGQIWGHHSGGAAPHGTWWEVAQGSNCPVHATHWMLGAGTHLPQIASRTCVSVPCVLTAPK